LTPAEKSGGTLVEVWHDGHRRRSLGYQSVVETWRKIVEERRIAVVGSGIAGLTAAWLCRRAGHEVVLFEALPGCSMDYHVVSPRTQRNPQTGHVDIPLRITTPEGWRSFLTLCDLCGVETFDVALHLSFSGLTGETWLQTGPVSFAQRARPDFRAHRLQVLEGILQLRLALAGYPVTTEDPPTLASFVSSSGLAPTFFRQFVLPILSTICTCSEAALLRWPAPDLLRLFDNIVGTKRTRRLHGGTRALATALREGVGMRVAEPVLDVAPVHDGLQMRTAVSLYSFKRVIVAAQANEALALLVHPSLSAERSLLARFPYESGEIVTHQDERFMPRDRAHWTALNYFLGPDGAPSMWTAWTNPIEPMIGDAPPVFQTWDPLFEPEVGTVLRRVKMQRAVVTLDSRRAEAELRALHRQPGRNLFFCGSYATADVPLLESAVRSAVNAVSGCGIAVPQRLHDAANAAFASLYGSGHG